MTWGSHSGDSYQYTWRYNPEDSHSHIVAQFVQKQHSIKETNADTMTWTNIFDLNININLLPFSFVCQQKGLAK
jgi:hypothetical protein